MDISAFNMSYASGNMVVEDSSAVLAKNIANVFPTIHHNLKRAFHLNVKSQSEYNADSVPHIEVIPPSPPGRESKKSFVGVKLDKVLNQTIQVCRRYSMPYIHPEHLGDNLKKDLSLRRSSMPAISNKYLLQVPKPEKKKRRRHSLPVNMEQARKSYKVKIPQDFTTFTTPSNDKSSSKSHDDLSFDGRVHQVYISGFISDNDTFENISNNHGSPKGSPKNKMTRRKNNDGIILKRLVEAPVESTRSTEYLSNSCDYSDEDDDISTSPEQSLVSCLSMNDLHLDNNCHDDTNISLPSLIIDQVPSEIVDGRRRMESAAFRTECLYRTVSEPFDLDSSDEYVSLPCINYSTHDDMNKQHLRHTKTNKQINHTGDERKTRNDTGSHSNRFISGDILVKRGNKKCSNVTDEQLNTGIRNNYVLRNNKDTVTYKEYYLMKQQANSDCKCNGQYSTRLRSQSVVESTYNKKHARHHDPSCIKRNDSSSCCKISSKFKSLSTVDHNSNIVDDDTKDINKSDLINNSGFVIRQTSCDAIKSKNNNKTRALNSRSVVELSDSEHVKWLEEKGSCTINDIPIKTGNTKHRVVEEVHETYYRGGENVEQYVNIDYYSQSSADEDTCFNYDFNHSSLEKSNSMSHLYDMFNRARNRRRNFERPVSYHEDALNFDNCDDINGHEYDSLMTNNASSLDELENRSSDEEKSNFTNSMFRKAASLCELQNEKFKEGFAKLERRVCSGHSCSIEENREAWFPRLSFEDCSSCTSSRSKTSSYHSLLYDTDTASGYQIYQPTVCDVDNTSTEVETDDSCDLSEPTKMTIFRTKKDKIMKQGQEALGSFKDRLRKSKSNPFKY